MDFDPTSRQAGWRAAAEAVGRALAPDARETVIHAALAGAGLLGADVDLVAAACAVEALAARSAAAGMTLALQVAVRLAVDGREPRLDVSASVAALALSSEDVPSFDGVVLSGRASWVGPLAPRGVAVVGARSSAGMVACLVSLDAPGVGVERLATSALPGLQWGHLSFAATPSTSLGAPARTMAVARTLIAAVALGIGDRALSESLAVVARDRGAGGEQTVQGLLADSATELDAARLLTWKAAAQWSLGQAPLADASMAKLAAAAAAQAAVVRATQVVGVDSFRRGHAIEQLTQDVRAIEVFAGRTEALREAVAGETLPLA